MLKQKKLTLGMMCGKKTGVIECFFGGICHVSQDLGGVQYVARNMLRGYLVSGYFTI